MNNEKFSLFSIVKACAVGYLTIVLLEFASFMIFGVGPFGAMTGGKYDRHFKPKVDHMVEGSKEMANKAMYQQKEKPNSLLNKSKEKAKDVLDPDNVERGKEKVQDIIDPENLEKGKEKVKDTLDQVTQTRPLSEGTREQVTSSGS